MCHHSDASVLCVRHLRCPFLLSICLWQHDHVLPLAPSKFDYVFVSELKVATRFEILAVQLRAITAFQIDNVGLDLSSLARTRLRSSSVCTGTGWLHVVHSSWGAQGRSRRLHVIGPVASNSSAIFQWYLPHHRP